jgi:hypothetical protein
MYRHHHHYQLRGVGALICSSLWVRRIDPISLMADPPSPFL